MRLIMHQEWIHHQIHRLPFLWLMTAVAMPQRLHRMFHCDTLRGMLKTYHKLCKYITICRFIRPILMLVYSFWIPQIVHCARTNVRQPLRPLYIVGMSLTRLLLPLYLYGCPSNVLMIVPSPVFCVVLVAWLSLQVC